jgi:hypothetical protein
MRSQAYSAKLSVKPYQDGQGAAEWMGHSGPLEWSGHAEFTRFCALEIHSSLKKNCQRLIRSVLPLFSEIDSAS